MDILKQLNNTVIYIENNLCGEIYSHRICSANTKSRPNTVTHSRCRAVRCSPSSSPK